jgi:hypothetical protein
MERVIALTQSGSWPRRFRARTVLALTTVLAALSIASVTLAPAASSQADPAVSGPRQRLARAQADTSAATDRLAQAVTEREQAQTRINDLEQSITAARAEETALRAEIATHAVALYKSSDPSSGLEALGSEDRMAAGRKAKFTEAADEYYAKRAQDLHEMADKQEQSQVELDKRRGELDHDVGRLEREKADSEQKIAKATRGVEISDQLGPLRAAGEPIMGPTVLNAEEMAAWLRTTGSSPRLSGGVTLEQIGQMFVDEGTAENVRGDLAFAQAYIETGGFSAGGSENNFSGLGACDGCGSQNQFPTALDGIRAQIQLLKAYAGGGPLVHPPSPYWWRGDAAGAYASFSGTGDAPTWREMGGGNWATDGAYAGKVLGTYDKMIASAGGS